jgi:hypothetical protein
MLVRMCVRFDESCVFVNNSALPALDRAEGKLNLLPRVLMEAAGVGLDTVFRTGLSLQFLSEIETPETPDPLKGPGEPPNRPQ